VTKSFLSLLAASSLLGLASPLAAAPPVRHVAKPAAKAAAAAPAASAADPFLLVPEAKPQDVGSPDAIVTALYDVISGDAGTKRDWNRFRSLFYPGARMIPSGKNSKTGKINALVGSTEQYIAANREFLEDEGFHEVELGRRVETYGPLVHVFSAYEGRRKLTDAEPFLRGVNSLQLLNDGTRWWILTVAWTPETAENPLPKDLLNKAKP
jgi:hypothetical protein